MANDALVDVDTVRYSVPHRLVRDTVDVVVGGTGSPELAGPELTARSLQRMARLIEATRQVGIRASRRLEIA